MSSTATEGPLAAKTRKRRAAQGVKAANPQAAEKVKITLHVSVDANQRLGVQAAMTRVDRSALVDDLIRTHCREFVVQRRGPRDTAMIGEPGTAA